VCWSCHEEITRMDRGDLEAIVAAKDAEHERFVRAWNTALAERLKVNPSDVIDRRLPSFDGSTPSGNR
jgi:hypothetical protein